MLRLPDGMRDRIKDAADKSGRSMNAEIVGTLEEAYPEPLTDEIEIAYSKMTRVINRLRKGASHGSDSSIAFDALQNIIDEQMSEVVSSKDTGSKHAHLVAFSKTAIAIQQAINEFEKRKKLSSIEDTALPVQHKIDNDSDDYESLDDRLNKVFSPNRPKND